MRGTKAKRLRREVFKAIVEGQVDRSRYVWDRITLRIQGARRYYQSLKGKRCGK